MRRRWEPVTEVDPRYHIVLDTSGDRGDTARRLLYELFASALSKG